MGVEYNIAHSIPCDSYHYYSILVILTTASDTIWFQGIARVALATVPSEEVDAALAAHVTHALVHVITCPVVWAQREAFSA